MNRLNDAVGPRSKIYRVLDSPLMGRVVLLGVILSLVIGGFATVKVESFANCLAKYNNASQASTEARAMLNQEQIDATNAVIIAVATATSRNDVTSALSQFTVTQNIIKQGKLDHPVPPPPSEVCR